MASYWSRVLDNRVSRRRALAGTGGIAIGAALLAACGGSDSGGSSSGGGSSSQQPVSSLIYQPQDTSSSAKRGGVRKTYLTTDPTTFDIHIFQITAQSFVWAVGSLLFTLVPGHLGGPKLEVKGDIAQSFELSPDKMTLTVKMHPQAKWGPLGANSKAAGVPDSIAGRTMDSADVLASWDRFSELGLGRTEMNNTVNPNAPISSVTAPDNSTVVFKMVRPDSTLLPTMSVSNVGYFYLIPKEGKGADWFKRTMVGGGPFYIDEYTPSARMVFKRNPYLEQRDQQKRPYVDTVEAPILNDPAQGQAQFRSGNIWSGSGGLGLPLGVTASDVLGIKKDLPQLNLFNNGVGSDPQKLVMGNGKDSIFKDKRVRQAMFQAWDRDLYIEVIFNVSKFKDAGLPMETRWNVAMPCSTQGYPGGTYDPYWLDPQGKDFGPNAKYYKHDPAEAKKLLAAAGFNNGAEFDMMWSLPNSFGPGTGKAVDTLSGMIQDGGFKPKVANLQTPQWLDTVQNSNGNFSGAATAIDSGGPDPANYLFQHYHSAGTRFGGFNPAGTGWSKEGDPYLNDNIIKLKTEFDEKKRVQIVYDLTRYIAEAGYNPRYPGGATGLALQWPVLQNSGVWIGDFPRQWANEWIDDTKPPIGKS